MVEKITTANKKPWSHVDPKEIPFLKNDDKAFYEWLLKGCVDIRSREIVNEMYNYIKINSENSS